MSARDKYDSLTKEGCARVFNHKLFNIVHSYTVECGYFAPNRINPLIPLKDIANSGQYGYENDWE